MPHNNVPACDCDGWWEQDCFGRQPMEQLRIAFDAGRVEGSGVDIIGPFVLRGNLEQHGAVAIVKQYIGQHHIDYLGVYDGEGTMAGEWRIGPFRGRWLITLRRHRGTEQAVEIIELVPGSGSDSIQ